LLEVEVVVGILAVEVVLEDISQVHLRFPLERIMLSLLELEVLVHKMVKFIITAAILLH
jgi:hypothetical protein